MEITIEQYLKTMIEGVPKYIFRLFEQGFLQFLCTEDGMLGWRFSDDVPRRVQLAASQRIHKYTKKHPLEIKGVESGVAT